MTLFRSIDQKLANPELRLACLKTYFHSLIELHAMYTTVHFIPANQEWRPTQAVLGDLMQYFGAHLISLSGYADPEHWDAEDPPRPEFSLEQLSPEGALRHVAITSPTSALIILEDLQWSRSLAASLSAAIRPELADGYVAWDVHMWLGLRTISDPIGERTVAETNFDLTISGDGMPADLERYRQLMANVPEIVDLRRKLAEINGVPWRNLITATY